MKRIVSQKKHNGNWFTETENVYRIVGKTKKKGQIRNFVIGRIRTEGMYVGPSPSNNDLADLINKITGWNISYKNPRNIIKRFYMEDPPILFKSDLTKTKKVLKKSIVRKKKKLDFAQTNDFLQSYEWKRTRVQALKNNNGCCELCGRSKKDGIVLNVDHVKPRKKYPELALDVNNLQVLCHDCNHGKGNWDETDWR